MNIQICELTIKISYLWYVPEGFFLHMHISFCFVFYINFTHQEIETKYVQNYSLLSHVTNSMEQIHCQIHFQVHMSVFKTFFFTLDFLYWIKEKKMLHFTLCPFNCIVFNLYYNLHSLSFEGIGNDQILALGSALLNKWVSSSLLFSFAMFFVFVLYLGHLAPVSQLRLWAGSSPWRQWCRSNPESVGWCWAVWPQP